MDTTKLYDSHMYTHILTFSQNHPPLLQIIYLKIHIVWLISTPTFTQFHYPIHKSKNNPSFCIWNCQNKIPLYQILLLFHLYLTLKGTNLPLVFMITINSIFPVLLYIILKYDILLYIYVRVPIFPFLLLHHIHKYIPK